MFKVTENEKYYSYDTGDTGARMLFTRRGGGVSNGRYASLNMGYSTNDSKDNIYRNRAIVLNDFGLGIDKMVSSDQVHGVRLVEVTDPRTDCGECDGLFTREKNIVLCMYFADCTPLFFIDPVRRVIGLVHAGWRGTCNRIGADSVAFMAGNFGSRPGDIRAVIGPSIGECCFEVGGEVADEFMRKIEKSITSKYITKKNGPETEKFLINLKAINRELLLGAGIAEGNIFTHRLCTSCLKDQFFSYRRDERDTGRMAGLAFLV